MVINNSGLCEEQLCIEVYEQGNRFSTSLVWTLIESLRVVTQQSKIT